MEYQIIANFLANYSLPTLAISLIVTIIVQVLVLVFRKKIPNKIKRYLPSILAIILQLFYNFIFVSGKFELNFEVLSAGILSSSLSTVILVVVEKLIDGTISKKEAVIFLIEGIISGFIESENTNKLAKEICLIITKVTDEEKAKLGILDILTKTSSCDANELIKLAGEIISSVKNLK